MREYSTGTIRKKQKYNGEWEWQAFINVTEKGKGRQLTKMTGVACTPGSKKRNGKGAQPTGKGARQALDFLKAWRDELVAAEAASVPNPTLDIVPEFVERYIATLDVEPGTRYNYRGMVKYMNTLDMPFSKLDAQAVEQWKLDMAEAGLGSTMRNKAFNLLKYACNWGVAIGSLMMNPCSVVKAPQRPKHQPNPLDPSELPRLLAALEALRANQPAFADMCLLALNTGMRRGELCALTFGDVSGSAVHVNRVIARGDSASYIKDYPKNGHRRSIDVNGAIKEIIERRKQALSPFASDISRCFVFGSESDPEKFPEPNGVSHLWNMFSSMNGFVGVEGRRLRFHDLRDTFATVALVNGVPVVTVAAILGHATSQTTLTHYSHFIPSKNKEAMDFMDGLLNAG